MMNMKYFTVDRKRIKTLKEGPPSDGAVIYVMSRDQRVDDNWAILYAQELAIDCSQPLLVIACPVADYPGASDRQKHFAVQGLKEVDKRLSHLGIPMHVFPGPPDKKLPALIKKIKPSALVFDFSPLRESRNWKDAVLKRIDMSVYEVDAHNIVPAWEASTKLEYAAYTLRPKINRLLPAFLTGFPSLKKHPVPWLNHIPTINWEKIAKDLKAASNNPPQTRFKPGENEAKKLLNSFLSQRLTFYNDQRNDPNAGAQSDLSPYLHFGQISAQRVALESQRYDGDIKSQEAFVEELVVRRELSDNFCYYNENYVSFDGFPDWARNTLDDHRLDPRPYLYSSEQLEAGETHDDLWNAAQLEMQITGKMHGYLRMYWAKKILEWSHSPEEAMATAIYLNDKYELDGCDPNGYAGIAWSIGGVHDRPWFEREIFGKIRFMSYGGCRRKFDIKRYIAGVTQLEREFK
jgi:deoxyribodipyrimidine photo-lyase